MNAHTSTLIQHLRDKREERYASKLQHQRFDVLRRRSVRRSLVVASFVLLLGAVLLLWVPSAEEAGSSLLYLAVALLFAAGMTLLNVTMRAHWPDRALDERLLAIRNHAYQASYRIIAIATGLGLFAISVAWETQWAAFAFERHHLRALLLAFVGLAFMAPTAVLAWREREI